jgi:hypothetical protein
VVKTDGSFLDAITTCQEWDDPGTGYRLRLQEELANFEEIHGTYLDEYFASESGQGYAICRLALTESMGWIEGLITFIDTYYRELTKAKFGSPKAWHVTTRLAKRVLDEVGTTRQSAQGGFEAGNAVKICQNIVWAVLKAHDVMAEYKRLSFKNHPSVATELVKFLAINTSFESIEKLVTQTKALEAEVSELKKQVSAAVKSSASSSNKADEAESKAMASSSGSLSWRQSRRDGRSRGLRNLKADLGLHHAILLLLDFHFHRKIQCVLSKIWFPVWSPFAHSDPRLLPNQPAPQESHS